MTFAASEYLVYLWLLPLCSLLLWFSARRVNHRLRSFTKLRVDELLTHEVRKGRVIIKSVLFVVGIALVVVALSRPRWGFDWQEVPHGGVDIMLALDLSSSMLANDISPSRLERAKREIIDLIGMLEGDRIGIVAFAGVSFVQCPLTSDYRLASMFVKQLDTKLMPVQGTNIASALKKSMESLEKASDAKSQGKAIILMTDGEDSELDFNGIVAQAKEKEIKIYAIGIGGEEGAPIPLPHGGFKKDRQGQVILSKLDEALLQNLAVSTNGMYVRSTVGDMDLDSIYKAGIRSSIDDKTYGTKRKKIWHERFQWFVLFAFITLLIEGLISMFRAKRQTALKRMNQSKVVKQVGVLCFMIVISPLFLDVVCADTTKSAEKAFHEKDFKVSSDLFLEAEIEDPKDLKHSYNRGVSLFHEKKYNEALQAFQRSSQSVDTILKKKSLFNLGNTQVASGDLKGAVKTYDQVLKMDPNSQETKENKKWVEAQIRKMDQQKQQNKQKSDKDSKDKNEKEEKQDQQQKQENKQNQHEKKQDQQQNQSEKKQDQQQTKQPSQSDQTENKQNNQQQHDMKKEENKQQEQQNAKDDVKKEQQLPSQSEKRLSDKKEKSSIANDKQSQEAHDKMPLTKEETERLLRVIDDLEKVYGAPPRITEKPKASKKDW